MRPNLIEAQPSSRTSRKERGANMVELAIIAPIIALLVMGLLELGLAWRDSLTVATAARSGARVGSNLGPERLSDYETVQGVLAAIADIDDANVELVVVYDATNNADPHPQCIDATTPTPRTFANAASRACNVYTNATLATLNVSQFGTTTVGGVDSCKFDAIDRFWCPYERVYTSQQNLGYFGVFVRTKYESITNILPIGDLTLEDKTVMRVEPRLEATGP